MTKTNQKFSGYRVLICAVIVMIMNYGITASLPIFLPAIGADLAIDYTKVALMLTVSSAVTFVLAFFCGFIIKKIGQKISFILGMLLVGIPCFMFAKAQNMNLLILGSVIQGAAGAVFINVVISSIIKNWFLEKRASLIGYAFFGSSIGSSIFLYIGGKLIEAYNWRVAFAVIGGFCLVAGIIFSFFVVNMPSDLGQNPKGKEEEVDRNVNLEGYTLKEVLGKPAFWMLLSIVTIFNIFIMSLPTFAAGFWMEAGMDIVTASKLLTICTILCAFSTLVSGRVADKFGNKVYVTYLHIAYIISAIFAVLSIGTLNYAYIWISLLGLVIAIPLYTSMIPTITFSLYGNRDYEKINGFFMAGINIGLMLIAPVCMWIVSALGSFKYVYSIALVVCIISLIITLVCLNKTYKR